MKLNIFKIGIICFLAWLIYILASQWPDDLAHIIFCDVGQGDAILIIHKNRQMLIDGGPDDSVINCLEENMPFWDRTLDFLIISHMDLDHIGGLPTVLSRYSVNIILRTITTKKTADFEALETAVSRKSSHNTQILAPYVGQHLKLSHLVDSIVISPQVTYGKINADILVKTETILSDNNAQFSSIIDENISENDRSIVLIVLFQDVRLLLTGDLEKPGELAVLESGLTEPINIIKVGHHGSKSSSTRPFIEAFRPEIAVISSGKNNQYNHPFPQVIDLFNELGVDIYRTDTLGSVKFATDGSNYWRVN